MKFPVILIHYTLFVGIITILMGIFTLQSQPNDKRNRIFFLMTLFSGLSTTFNSFYHLIGYYFRFLSAFCEIVYPLFGSVVPALFGHFVLVFPFDILNKDKRKWILIPLYLPALYFAII